MTPAAIVLAAALLLIPGPTGADTVIRVSNCPDHVVVWDETHDRPATVNLWKNYLSNPQQPVQDVTVNNQTYHLVEYSLNGDYFDSPFAHDVVARIVAKDGGDEPDRDSVDHVVRNQPAGSAGDIERCLSLLGVCLYSEETISTQQGQSVRYHYFVTCDGWDAYFDEDLWPTRDLNGDGRDEPTILWMPVGSRQVRETVPFLIQPKNDRNAVLIAEKPADWKIDVNGQEESLSNWIARVRLSLPQVHAENVYLLYVVGGPAEEQPKATVHVDYLEGGETTVGFTLLDWCITSVDPNLFVIDVNRGVGLSMPQRVHLFSTGGPPQGSHREIIWTHIHAIKVPVDETRTLKSLWVDVDLSTLSPDRPYYIWLLALTIKRADGTYLLVLGPQHWIEIAPNRGINLTVSFQNLSTVGNDLAFDMEVTLETNDTTFVNNLDRVTLSFYGNCTVGDRTRPVHLEVRVPQDLERLVRDGLRSSYDPSQGRSVYRPPQVELGVDQDAANAIGANVQSVSDVQPVEMDLRVWSYDLTGVRDNAGNAVPVSIVAVPGLVLTFTGNPINITSGSVDFLYYLEKGGRATVVAELTVNFNTASDAVNATRLLVKAETPTSHLPLAIGYVDYKTTNYSSLNTEDTKLGDGSAVIQPDSPAVDSGSREQSSTGKYYYFKSPIHVKLWFEGPADVIRNEGIKITVSLSGTYGAESNELDLSLDQSEFEKIPRITEFKFAKHYDSQQDKADIKIVATVKLPDNMTISDVSTTASAKVYSKSGEQQPTLSMVSQSKVGSDNKWEITYEGSVTGDPLLALITFTLEPGTSYTGRVGFHIEFNHVWPADAFISDIKSCELVTSDGTRYLKVEAKLTYYVSGDVTLRYDGNPVLMEVNGQTYVGRFSVSTNNLGQGSSTNNTGKGSKINITESKVDITLWVPAEPGKHVMEVEFSGTVMNETVVTTKTYCYWDITITEPKVKGAWQVWYDNRDGKVLVSVMAMDGLSIEADLQYQSKVEETKKENNVEWTYYYLETASKSFRIFASSEELELPNGERTSVQRVGDYVIAWIPINYVKEWMESGGVATFYLVERLSNGDECKYGFGVRFTKISWRSGDVCVNVMRVGDVIELDVWRVDLGNDNKVKSIDHVGSKVLHGCSDPVYLGDNLLVYYDGGKGAQVCGRVVVDVNNKKVDVTPLSGFGSGVDEDNDGRADYRVRAFYDGADLVLMAVSVDERDRYACELVREPADVGAVSVVGPLVIARLTNGTERAYWVSRNGVKEAVDCEEVQGGFVVSLAAGGGVEVLEVLSGNGVGVIERPVASGGNVFLFRDGVLVSVDDQGKIASVSRASHRDVSVYGSDARAWVTEDGLVVVVKGGEVLGSYRLPGKIVSVDAEHGVVLCRVDGGPRPVLLTVSGTVSPVLQGWSVDGRRVFVFEVGGRSVVVLVADGEVLAVDEAPGRPVLLEGGVLVTSAGAWWVTSGGLASPERVSGGQGRVMGRPVSARVRSLGGGGGGGGGPVIPVLPPVRRRRRATA